MARQKAGRSKGGKCCLTCLIVCIILAILFAVALVVGANFAFNKFVSPHLGGVKLSEVWPLITGIFKADEDKIVTQPYSSDDLYGEKGFYSNLNNALLQKPYTAEENRDLYITEKGEESWNALSPEDQNALNKEDYVKEKGEESWNALSEEERGKVKYYRINAQTLLSVVDLEGVVGEGTVEEAAFAGEVEGEGGENMIQNLAKQLVFDFATITKYYPYDDEDLDGEGVTAEEKKIYNRSITSFTISGQQVSALIADIMEQLLGVGGIFNSSLAGTPFDGIDLSKILEIPQVLVENDGEKADSLTDEQLNSDTRLGLTLKLNLDTAISEIVRPMFEQFNVPDIAMKAVNTILPKKLFLTACIYPFGEGKEASLSINNYDKKQQKTLAKILNALLGETFASMMEGEEAAEAEEGATEAANTLMLSINDMARKTFDGVRKLVPMNFVADGSRIALKMDHIQALLNVAGLYDIENPTAESNITPHMFLSALNGIANGYNEEDADYIANLSNNHKGVYCRKCLKESRESLMENQISEGVYRCDYCNDQNAGYSTTDFFLLDLESKYAMDEGAMAGKPFDLNEDSLGSITDSINLANLIYLTDSETDTIEKEELANEKLRVKLGDRSLAHLLTDTLLNMKVAGAEEEESKSNPIMDAISVNRIKILAKSGKDVTNFSYTVTEGEGESAHEVTKTQPYAHIEDTIFDVVAELNIKKLLNEMTAGEEGAEPNPLIASLTDAMPSLFILQLQITVREGFVRTSTMPSGVYTKEVFYRDFGNADEGNQNGVSVNKFDINRTQKLMSTLKLLISKFAGEESASALDVDQLLTTISDTFSQVFTTLENTLGSDLYFKGGEDGDNGAIILPNVYEVVSGLVYRVEKEKAEDIQLVKRLSAKEVSDVFAGIYNNGIAVYDVLPVSEGDYVYIDGKYYLFDEGNPSHQGISRYDISARKITLSQNGDKVCIDGEYIDYDASNPSHQGLTRYNITYAEVPEILDTADSKVIIKARKEDGDNFLAELSSKYYLKTPLTAEKLFGDQPLDSLFGADSLNFKEENGLYTDKRDIEDLAVSLSGPALAGILNASGVLEGKGLAEAGEESNSLMGGLEILTADFLSQDGFMYLDIELRAKLGASSLGSEGGFNPAKFIPEYLYVTAKVMVDSLDPNFANQNGVYQIDTEGAFVSMGGEYIAYDKENPSHGELTRYAFRPRYETTVVVNKMSETANKNLFSVISALAGDSFDTQSICDTVKDSLESAFSQITDYIPVSYYYDNISNGDSMVLSDLFDSLNSISFKQDKDKALEELRSQLAGLSDPLEIEAKEAEIKAKESEKYASDPVENIELRSSLQEFGRNPISQLKDGDNNGLESLTNKFAEGDSNKTVDDINRKYYINGGVNGEDYITSETLLGGDLLSVDGLTADTLFFDGTQEYVSAVDGTTQTLYGIYKDTDTFSVEEYRVKVSDKALAEILYSNSDSDEDDSNGKDHKMSLGDMGFGTISQIIIEEKLVESVLKNYMTLTIETNLSLKDKAMSCLVPDRIFITVVVDMEKTMTLVEDPENPGEKKSSLTAEDVQLGINDMDDEETEDFFARIKKLSSSLGADASQLDAEEIKKTVADLIGNNMKILAELPQITYGEEDGKGYLGLPDIYTLMIDKCHIKDHLLDAEGNSQTEIVGSIITAIKVDTTPEVLCERLRAFGRIANGDFTYSDKDTITGINLEAVSDFSLKGSESFGGRYNYFYMGGEEDLFLENFSRNMYLSKVFTADDLLGAGDLSLTDTDFNFKKIYDYSSGTMVEYTPNSSELFGEDYYYANGEGDYVFNGSAMVKYTDGASGTRYTKRNLYYGVYCDERPWEEISTTLDNKSLGALSNKFINGGRIIVGGCCDNPTKGAGLGCTNCFGKYKCVGSARVAQILIERDLDDVYVRGVFVFKASEDANVAIPENLILITRTKIQENNTDLPHYTTDIVINGMTKEETIQLFHNLISLQETGSTEVLTLDSIKDAVSEKLHDIFFGMIDKVKGASYGTEGISLPNIFEYFTLTADEYIRDDSATENFYVKIGLNYFAYDSENIQHQTALASDGKYLKGMSEKVYDAMGKETGEYKLTTPEDFRRRLKEYGKSESILKVDGTHTWDSNILENNGAIHADSGEVYLDNRYDSTSDDYFYQSLVDYYYVTKKPTADSLMGSGNMFANINASSFNMNGIVNGYLDGVQPYAFLQNDSGSYYCYDQVNGYFNTTPNGGKRYIKLADGLSVSGAALYGLNYYHGAQQGGVLSDKAMASIITKTAGDKLNVSNASGILFTTEIMSMKVKAVGAEFVIETTVKASFNKENENIAGNMYALPDHFYLTTFTSGSWDEVSSKYVCETKLTLNGFGSLSGETENLITNLSQIHVGNFDFENWFDLDDVKASVNNTIQDSLSDLRTALNMDLTFNNFSAEEEEKGKGFIGFGSFYEVLATKMGQGKDKAETLQDILTKLHAEIPSVNPISTDYNFVTDFIADGKKIADKDFGRYLASLYDVTAKTVEASITDVYLIAKNEARADKLAYLNAFDETAALEGISDIVFVTAEVDMSAYACSGAVNGILPNTVKATIALDLSNLDGEGGAYLTFNGMTAEEKALLMAILTTDGNKIDGVLTDIKKITKNAFTLIGGGSTVHVSTTEGATYPDSTAIEGIGYLYV